MAKKAIRPIRIEGNIAYVPLTHGYEAIIDADDVPLVSGVRWRVLRCPRTQYAVSGKGSTMMHRMITNAPSGMEVDHINGDGLCNTRANLRVVTKNQNQHNCRLSRANKSGVKGVFAKPCGTKWTAQIRHNKKLHHLGVFGSLEAAAAAYAGASVSMHGEYGRIACA